MPIEGQDAASQETPAVIPDVTPAAPPAQDTPPGAPEEAQKPTTPEELAAELEAARQRVRDQETFIGRQSEEVRQARLLAQRVAELEAAQKQIQSTPPPEEDPYKEEDNAWWAARVTNLEREYLRDLREEANAANEPFDREAAREAANKAAQQHAYVDFQARVAERQRVLKERERDRKEQEAARVAREAQERAARDRTAGAEDYQRTLTATLQGAGIPQEAIPALVEDLRSRNVPLSQIEEAARLPEGVQQLEVYAWAAYGRQKAKGGRPAAPKPPAAPFTPQPPVQGGPRPSETAGKPADPALEAQREKLRRAYPTYRNNPALLEEALKEEE